MPNPVVNPTIIPSTVPIPFPSARDPAPKVIQLKVAVPKTGQKNALPREDAPEVPVGRVPVPKTDLKPPLPRDNLYPMGTARVPCAQGLASCYDMCSVCDFHLNRSGATDRHYSPEAVLMKSMKSG